MIFSIDPGKTTGLAVWSDTAPVFVAAYEIPNRYEFAELVSVQMPTEIVCEQFVISERTIRTAQDVNALRLIGWLDIFCNLNGIPFTLQTAAQAKRFATDDKLKALGWYETGRGHATDAARHLLVYLKAEHPMMFREHLLPSLMVVL